MKTEKHKHLTLDDRNEIEKYLNIGMTFKAIAARIGKDQTTVSKEVKKYLTFTQGNAVYRNKNGEEVPTPVCPKLLKTPFTCNPCEKKRYACPYQKQRYVAKTAQKEYEALLVEAREGLPMTEESFWKADTIIADKMKNGQHLYHILKSNDIEMSKSAAYRNLHKGYLSVSKIEFPRVVKFKPRRKKTADYVPQSVKIGRTYTDFLAFTEENTISSWVEMDTLIGRVGGKVIMTFDFTFCNFMFGLLLDNKTAAEAAAKIRSLKGALNDQNIRFGDVIPLLLTDNGGEFSNISAFISDLNGEIETDLFFCDPMCSFQKPKVEKNHTLFRDIAPKGQSFDHFTQDTVNLVFSHVNGIKRKSLGGKSPYEMFAFTYGDSIASVLGIKPIPPDRVIQSPKLLSR